MHRIFKLFFIIFIFSACSPIDKEDVLTSIESEVLTNIEIERVHTSIIELSKEPRVAGTKSEKNASVFLTEQLEQIGYKVEIQTFEFDNYIPPNSVDLIVDGFDGSLTATPIEFSATGDVMGELINAGFGLKSEYDKINIEGKIALVYLNTTSLNEIVLDAAKAGATAVIICLSDDFPSEEVSLGNHDDEYVPALVLSNEEGIALSDFIKQNIHVIGNLKIDGSEVETNESQNVIATKMSTSKMHKSDDIVIIGAHYDTVNHSKGASDNASGTAVLLEVARVIREAPTESEIRFIFFGSEEIGLLGSEKYVSEMTSDEIKRTTAMFNMDMVGSADAGLLTMFTVDGMPNIVTKSSNKASEILFQKTMLIDSTDRSDHSPFHNVGINAALFSYFPLEESYHSPDDTIEKLSKERLENIAGIITLAVLDLTLQNADEK